MTFTTITEVGSAQTAASFQESFMHAVEQGTSRAKELGYDRLIVLSSSYMGLVPDQLQTIFIFKPSEGYGIGIGKILGVQENSSMLKTEQDLVREIVRMVEAYYSTNAHAASTVPAEAGRE